MKHAQGQKQSPSIYGFHAVREAWLNPQRHIDALFVTAQSRGGFEATMQEAKKKGLKRPSPTEIDKQKFDRMLPQGAVHQGLALACAPLEDLDERDLMIKLGDKPEAVIAILDQVTDPHNVGAILMDSA